jgi:hypothetical protein
VAQNPYEPPKAEVVAGSSSGSGLAYNGPPLAPDLEAKAMELLGRMRSRSAGASFAVAWAICIAVLVLFMGLLLAFIVGAAMAGAISRYHVKSRTQVFVDRVSAQLGIPAGAFQPQRYLI